MSELRIAPQRWKSAAKLAALEKTDDLAHAKLGDRAPVALALLSQCL